MDILILGGTGAMGMSLVKLLSETSHNVFVTSRSVKQSYNNIHFIQGNAKDNRFLNELLERKYDVIVDFMVYDTKVLAERLPVLLNKTEQYFFFSSSRCYADSSTPITEDSPRLVDSCSDQEYLATDEYGLAKGREEDLLRKSGKLNWTIIRPYITYNSNRIQLGVYEKEDWLQRALMGKTVVFPKDIYDKKTTLTFGDDVAKAILKLIGDSRALGEAFHITSDESFTWGQVLDFYCKVIEKNTGKKIKVKILDDSKELQAHWNKWQIKYDRLYNREFDNSKIKNIIGEVSEKSFFENMSICLEEFLNNPKWLYINPSFEGWCDKQTGEFTSLRSFIGIINKTKYVKHRLLK